MKDGFYRYTNGDRELIQLFSIQNKIVYIHFDSDGRQYTKYPHKLCHIDKCSDWFDLMKTQIEEVTEDEMNTEIFSERL